MRKAGVICGDRCKWLLLCVALRVLSKGRGAGQRAEIVGRLVQEQATDCVFWIDRHQADWVKRKVIGVLIHANDCEDFDRLSDVR